MDSMIVSVQVTPDILQHICPRTKHELLVGYTPYLQQSLELAEAISPLRAAAFLAQLAFETNWFQTMVEEVCPDNTVTIPFDKYEGAHRLGNSQPGDGSKFIGRGWPQITGRANYTECGTALGLDLVNKPEDASLPQNAARIAAWYWLKKDLNPPADAGDMITITKRINGGLNGLAYRQAAYQHAKEAFGLPS